MWQKLTDFEYHSRPEISFHGLMDCLKSYSHYQTAKLMKKETQAMRFGTLAHVMALEPLRFKESVKVMPKMDRRTKEGKAAFEAFHAAAKPTDLVCDEDEYERLLGMRSRLDEAMKDERLGWIFSEIERVEEALIFELAEIDGKKIMARMKPDAIGKTFILDYKTTQDASYYGFLKTVKNYNYDAQLFFYQKGESLVSKTKKELIILAQETEPPFEFQFFLVPQDNASDAWNLIDIAFNKYLSGLDGSQVGYPRELLTLNIQRGYL